MRWWKKGGRMMVLNHEVIGEWWMKRDTSAHYLQNSEALPFEQMLALPIVSACRQDCLIMLVHVKW